jgi:magnesium transporter
MAQSTTKKYPSFQYIEHHWLSDSLRNKLKNEFHIVESDIEDVFSPTQLSKFEIRKNYAYFALQFAETDGKNKVHIQQIHCFVSLKFLFVIDEDGFAGIRDFDRRRTSLVSTKNYNSFDLFYELLDMSVIRMFAILSTIHTRIKSLEATIFSEESMGNDQLSEIQDIKKNIINFKSLLMPLYDMFEELSLKHTDLIDETGKEAIDDSLDKIKKLLNKLDNFREMMKLLTETNEMITARSTNQNVRRLTLFNVLLLCPTLIAGFFGMNVHFGWFTLLSENSALIPLWVIVITMLMITGCTYLFFLWKKWV